MRADDKMRRRRGKHLNVVANIVTDNDSEQLR